MSLSPVTPGSEAAGGAGETGEIVWSGSESEADFAILGEADEEGDMADSG